MKEFLLSTDMPEEGQGLMESMWVGAFGTTLTREGCLKCHMTGSDAVEDDGLQRV